MISEMMLYFLVMISLIGQGMAIIGYDCGTQSFNITTLSLLNVGKCEIPQDTVNVTNVYIQLLQINEYTETEIIQCKIEIHRTIYKCGMFSHISIVNNGVNEYIFETNKRACENLHLTGSIKINNEYVIHGIKINNTITHGVTFAGTVDSNGHCKGTTFSDPYGTWDSVIVQGTVKISLTIYKARVSLNKNQIHLASGTVCQLSESTCLDNQGYAFWNPLPTDSCRINQYGVLYEGLANKMIDLESNGYQTVYSLATKDITFALTVKSQEFVCGYKLIRTEHPKLVIFETEKGNTFTKSEKSPVSNLDIFAYINSKFVYVEKHIRSQMKALYKDVLNQKCNLERQTLKNALAIATQAPDEFAYHLMKGPGYMAVIAGEVVHIVKCIPVEVKIKHGDKCYAELEVEKGNTTLYFMPRTHILKTRGTEVNCNPLLPSYYFVGENWYKILPKPSTAIPPEIIQPMTQPTWKYINPSELATNGIYTEQDLRNLKDYIMFPVEKPAMLNSLAREMKIQPANGNEGALLQLFNEETVTKIIHSTWEKMWSKFLMFGTASAGVIGIMMIVQIIKVAIDILVRGYTLHSAFGWSLRLIGALWGTITHFLLYQSNINYKDKTEPSISQNQKSNFKNISINTETITEDETSENNTKNKKVYPDLEKADQNVNATTPTKFFNLEM